MLVGVDGSRSWPLVWSAVFNGCRASDTEGLCVILAGETTGSFNFRSVCDNARLKKARAVRAARRGRFARAP